MRKTIDTAPRNGVFVILEDDASGTYAVARWSAESAQWVDDDGVPCQLNATHWHLPQATVAPVNEVEARAGPVDNPRQGSGTIPSASAAVGGRTVWRRHVILAIAACLLIGAAIGPLLYHGDLDGLLFPGTAASENEASLKRALRQEQELTTRLASDATATRREAESQAGSFRQALEAANQQKEAGDRIIVQLRHELQLELAKADKHAAELAEAKRDGTAQASLARKAAEEAARAEAEKERIAGELRQALKQHDDKTAQASLRKAEQAALKQEQDKTEKLRAELAAARREGESRAAQLRSASDEATRLKEANAQAADDLRQALRQAQDKAEKLAGELTAARTETEVQTAAARAASDDARRAVETGKRSADEQGRALRDAQDKAEKLAAELSAERREAQSQQSAASTARDQVATVKEAAERSAAELRRAVQQERDSTEKLATELAEAKSGLETLSKARTAEQATRDHQLATIRGELQKAKAEAAIARESLEAERSRAERAEQQLAAGRENTASRLPSAASSVAPQPAIVPPSAPDAPTQPSAGPERSNPQAVRLIARANLLLEQGNIGAARNMLDRAAEMGSTEALFWLAETYDPLLLSARQAIGTQSDAGKARELYGQALAGGVGKAKIRLEALQQRTGGQ